jgi:cyclopropane fatty-acyl-phospholipid synthase-like methyltransferase
MRRDWDLRARENARHYVVTGRQQWTDEEFFRSGEITMQEDILNDLTNICQGRNPKEMVVLEIGCGAGRVTRAFANFFGEVHAVDISQEMVKRARQAVSDFPTAHIYRNSGRDLSVVRRNWWNRLGIGERVTVDFAFSTMVFQHIPSREIIENYVRGVYRLLRPGGLFKFQVQGAELGGIDPAGSWVGAPFSEAEARAMAARCGFEMRYQAGGGDQYYWLWYFKPEG